MTYGLKELTIDALKLNVQWAPEELSKLRYEICTGNPDKGIPKCEFFRDDKKCQRCGCYMPVKSKLTKAKCPVKKW
jgi:hypothetical protein